MHTVTLKRTLRKSRLTLRLQGGKARSAARAKMRRAIIQAAARHGLVVVAAPAPRNSALKQSLRRSLREAQEHNTKPVAELWNE